MKNLKRISAAVICFLMFNSANAQQNIVMEAPAGPDTITNIVSFTAINNEGKVYLKWLVKDQQHDGLYLIERAEDGKNFDIVGIKESVGTTLKSALLYCFTDVSPMSKTAFYRVRHVGDNNEYFLSDVVKAGGSASPHPSEISLKAPVVTKAAGTY